MKYKLKDGVNVSDIPRYSNAVKQIANKLSKSLTIDCDNMPDDLLTFVEEVVAAPKKDKKGDK